MTHDDYIIAAREWVGTPFMHQGRSRQIATDCIGLVYGAAIELGIKLGALPVYARQPCGGQLEAGLRACPAMTEVTKPAPGDVLVFRFARDLQHVGIYTGKNLIHAYQPIGKCIEHRFCAKWKNRQILAFRFRAFDE
jgi:cell wall-associated NlpC family hydrolase